MANGEWRMSDEWVDFHVHSFPMEWGEDPARFARENGEPFFGALMAPKNDPSKSLQGWLTPDEMLRKMDLAGIEKVVLQGWYWERLETCQKHNRWMAELMQHHPDRIAAYASMTTGNPSEVEAEFQWVVDHGFSGLGELHPTVQSFELNGDDFQPVVELAIAHQMPLLIHVTEPVGRPYVPLAETDYRALQRFIETVAPLPVILAHWGGLVFAHMLNPYIAKRWKHVYFDTAASPLLYHSKVAKLALQTVSPERLLYGSDFPLKVYPKDSDQPDFRRFIKELKSEIVESADGLETWGKVSRQNSLGLLRSYPNKQLFK